MDNFASPATYRTVEVRRRPAWRAAYAVTADRGLADEAAHEGMERAFRALDRFDETRPFAPWLKRIVVNRAIDHLRRGRRLEMVSGDEESFHTWDVGESAEDDLRSWAVAEFGYSADPRSEAALARVASTVGGRVVSEGDEEGLRQAVLTSSAPARPGNAATKAIDSHACRGSRSRPAFLPLGFVLLRRNL